MRADAPPEYFALLLLLAVLAAPPWIREIRIRCRILARAWRRVRRERARIAAYRRERRALGWRPYRWH